MRSAKCLGYERCLTIFGFEQVKIDVVFERQEILFTYVVFARVERVAGDYSVVDNSRKLPQFRNCNIFQVRGGQQPGTEHCRVNQLVQISGSL